MYLKMGLKMPKSLIGVTLGKNYKRILILKTQTVKCKHVGVRGFPLRVILSLGAMG